MPPKKPKKPKKKLVKKKANAKSKPMNVQKQQQTVNVFLATKRKSKAKKRAAPKQRGVSATQAMFGGLIGQQNALLNNLDARNDARLNTLEQLMVKRKVEDNSIGTEPAAKVGVGSNVSQFAMLPRREPYKEEVKKPTGESGGGLGAAAETPRQTPRRSNSSDPRQTTLFQYRSPG
jgi:hypothetical protein